VHELVEGMLTIGARLTKVHRTCVHLANISIHLHSLPIAFHVQLLQMCHKAHQGLAVRQRGTGLVAQAGRIPHRQQAHQHWKILLGRGCPEMLIHGVRTFQESVHNLKSILK